ncbi:MAG TPA: glycosyltransferase family 4 protein [Armatimonadota bacterium]|nr:glycosyltransferase family 4 protein [Armatimonadota bacterium]
MSKRTRVAIVTYAMSCGGAETFILTLAEYLSCEGFDVEVVTTEAAGEWFPRVSEMGLRAVHLPGWHPFFHSLGVGRYLAKGAYDVVLLNHAIYAQASLGMLPDDVIAIPIVHNDDEAIYRVACANRFAWNVAVCVSPKLAEAVRAMAPDRPVVQILDGISAPHGPREGRRPFERPIRLLFVGRLAHCHKGVLFLPDILRGCLDRGIDASLTIVGDGIDREALRQKVQDYGLQDAVRFCGQIPNEQVYDLMSDSHLLLMPSFYEGMGLVLPEAMWCGCVPIASRLRGVTDAVVEDGRTGILVEVADVDGFVDAIARLNGDVKLWEDMSRASHEIVSDRFTVEAMGESYKRLILDALDGRYPLPKSRKLLPAFDRTLFSWRDCLPGRVRRFLGAVRIRIRSVLAR